jgi:hypothetical protein
MIPFGHDASCVFNTGGFVPSTMAGVHLAFVEGYGLGDIQGGCLDAPSNIPCGSSRFHQNKSDSYAHTTVTPRQGD